MTEEREYWIETTDRTFLYYNVKARSKEEALEKFITGEGDYVGCNDESNEELNAILEDKPYIGWS